MRQLCVDLNGDSSHCHEKILEAFPKLAESGCDLQLYDRAGENSSFCVLKHPYLKVVAGQCKIYIKPLQKDLVETESDAEEEVEEQEEVSFGGFTALLTALSKSLDQYACEVFKS